MRERLVAARGESPCPAWVVGSRAMLAKNILGIVQHACIVMALTLGWLVGGKQESCVDSSSFGRSIEENQQDGEEEGLYDTRAQEKVAHPA